MKKKWIVFAMVLCMLATLFTGCGKRQTGSGGSGLTPVTLNEVAHSIFYAPMYVAIEEGYFKEEGIDLTLVTGFGAACQSKTHQRKLTRQISFSSI